MLMMLLRRLKNKGGHMGDFCFVGTLPVSKSIMNRALVIQSFNPGIEISSNGEAEDIYHMRTGLKSLMSGMPIDCGHAGTVFRFLALRLARIPGQHTLVGSKRLLSRPHEELIRILRQLGCDVELNNAGLHIISDGWNVQGDGLFIQGNESSQVASGLFLSAWNLKTPLHVNVSRTMVSADYFEMTLEVLRDFGMEIYQEADELFVPAGQTPSLINYQVELDVSSAFSVAAMAAVDGDACIRNFPFDSLQPDVRFISDFREMGISVRETETELKISQTKNWKGLDIDLKNSPDLFPVMSVMCALATGPSRISGISHIAFKESNRIKKTEELLCKMGAGFLKEKPESVIITPTKDREKSFDFNPDKDHRMAMAAAVAKKAGFAIQLNTPDLVRKSFPQFWQIAGGIQ